ncbi:MAG TPA: M20 family metallo-hydrolase [Baekduia sp.]|uniref:M20 family metallo-hydrolase n=1 Tax=Baekduia sp. TaxID=2600305 RepID=UPI002D79D7A0|nr:M20 family metallo-hydrolase [Baekduia sp.]HET6507975.1 M20 family metallo-hydrolase [Baekduia sp.]
MTPEDQSKEMQVSGTQHELVISEERLAERLARLAEIGLRDDGALQRLPYSPEDRAAQDLLTTWLEAAGLTVWVDPAGNVFGRLEGTDPEAPAVLTGSHLDTQPGGGRFDGVAGVLASLEALEAMREAGLRPRAAIELVSWAGEEGGGCFDVGVIGSRAMVGALTEQHLDLRCRHRGRTLRELMRECGLDVDRLGEAERPEGSLAAVVELHIEQGPLLEEAGIQVGVVTAIAGNRRVPLTLRGRQAHSGGMPMAYRHDALTGVAELVLAAEAIATAKTDPPVVATSGFLQHAPREIAMIPGRADLTLDVRCIAQDALEAAVAEIQQAARDIAERRGLELELRDPWGTNPSPTDPAIVAVLRAACDALGISATAMPSGASHDSMVLATRFPAGMLFVPSAGGISHAPEEFTETADLAAGARVLARALTVLSA